MKYLADTHILLWIMAEDIDSSPLSNKAKDILNADDMQLYFSFINVWEVALKRARHPDKIPYSAALFEHLCVESGICVLETVPRHAAVMETLKYDYEAAKEEHKDPFDKILLAQAKAENIFFLTHDHLIPFYNESCVILV